MSGADNQEATGVGCYNGPLQMEWREFVDTTVKAAAELFPKILAQGNQGNWMAVSPDFPNIDHDENQLKQIIKVFDWYTVFIQSKDIILKEQATREETKAIEIYDLTSGLIDIVKRRNRTLEKYLELEVKSGEIVAKKFCAQTRSKLIKYLENKTKEGKDELMLMFQNYNGSCNEFTFHLKDFEYLSRKLAEAEGKPFNEKFNKNAYINFHIYQKGKVDGKAIDVFLNDQESQWDDLLHTIQKASESVIPGPERTERIQAGRVPPFNPQAQFDKTYKELKETCTEIESALCEAGIERLDMAISDIKSLRSKVNELKSNHEITIKEEEKLFLSTVSSLIDKIGNQKRSILDKRDKEKEERRANLNTDVKSLGTIKMESLRGFDNYLNWKKSIITLNTHADNYKKCSALRATLRDDADLRRTEGIWDYQELLRILKEKYEHQEILVPALISRLTNLPKADSNDTLLQNFGEILNVHTQLESLSDVALSRFDQGLISKLVIKMTYECQIWYENFIHDREEDDDTTEQPSNNLIDVESSISGATLEAARQPLDPNMDESTKARKLFIKFLYKQEKILNKMKARSVNMSEKPKKCGKCKQVPRHCKCSKDKRHVYNVEKDQDWSCPVCHKKVKHVNKYDKVSTSLSACPEFRAMDLDGKRKAANTTKACYLCLKPGHSKNSCSIRSNCFKCKKAKHHPMLCTQSERGKREEKEAHSVRGKTSGTILMTTEGEVVDEQTKDPVPITIFTDIGANVNLISNKKAKTLGLRGRKTSIIMKMVSFSKRIKTKIYKLTLVDRDGKKHDIEAYGMDKVINDRVPLTAATLTRIAEDFNVDSEKINNVGGEIDLLLSTDCIRLLPTPTTKIIGNLGLWESKFGKRFVMVGSVGSSGESEVNNFDVRTTGFWFGDQLGMHLPPKCTTHIAAPECKPCKILSTPQSFKEQEHGKLILDSMNIDYEKKKVSISYPYIKDVGVIFHPKYTNYKIAEKMALSVRKGLERDGLMDAYTEAWADMIERKAIREISKEECDEWEAEGNPINYSSHHSVLKDSKSTACRVVCNSSLQHNGTSLNQCLPKGPTSINNLLHVLFRFRSRPYILISDLSKAYNAISTSKKDCHLRRMLWYRPEDLKDPNAKLRTFGYMCVAFGDTPAANILEYSKMAVSDYARNVMKDEVLADEILASMYVDDSAMSQEELSNVESFKQKLPICFGSLGFKIKETFVGGADCVPQNSVEKKLLLGHYYDGNDDTIEPKFYANFSPKKRSSHTEPNLTKKSDISKLKLNKRKMLSLLSSQYDPMGILSCYLAKYKIFVNHLFKENYGWDENLNEKLLKEGRSLVEEILNAEEKGVKFKRSQKPPGFKLKSLIVFADASKTALQVVMFGLYVKGNEIYTSLIGGKNRIANLSVPRNEMMGMTGAHRFAQNYTMAIEEKPEYIDFITDSTCTLDVMKATSTTKDVFTTNRVAEMRKISREMNVKCRYFHCASQLNVADKGTRGDCPFEYLSSSEWQNGPEWIKNVESKADLKFEIDPASNDYEVYQMEVLTENCPSNCLLNLMSRSNNLIKILRVICRVKETFKRENKHGRGSFKVTDLKYDLGAAFNLLLRFNQGSMDAGLHRIKQLDLFEENGIQYTNMRFTEESMKATFNKDKLPVVAGNSRLGKLLMQAAHTSKTGLVQGEKHCGLKQTLVNSRVHPVLGAYITYGKSIAKGIIHNCVVCRKKAKELTKAKMDKRKGGFGEIPKDPKNAGAFSKIAIDYFGPFLCRPPKGRETRGTRHHKIYGMAVLCQNTRAVAFYPVEGYDLISFQTAFRIHCNLYGVPEKILSDPMKAFVAGAKTLDNESQLKEKELEYFESTLSSEFGIEWEFIPPGSQWRNPCERTIKSLKEMMMSIFNNKNKETPVLTIQEYNLIFTDSAEMLNRRPIQGYLAENSEELSFISPNSLLLGRPTKFPVKGQDDNQKVTERQEMIKGLRERFWKEIQEIIIKDSRLFKYPKWYDTKRPPKVDDVILVLYKSKVSESYRTGVITKVIDHHNIECRVSPDQDSNLKTFKKPSIMNIPIQRTVLLYAKDLNEDGQ